MKKFLAIILCVSMMTGMCAFALAEEQITLNFQMWSDEEEVFTELIRIYEEQLVRKTVHRARRRR